MVGESAPGWTLWSARGSCCCCGMAGFSGSVVCHRSRYRRGRRLFGSVIQQQQISSILFMNSHETTQELDSARARYRGQIIPKSALAIMDAETSRLAASDLVGRALKIGEAAPDFILPDAHGEPVRLRSLLNNGPVVAVF